MSQTILINELPKIAAKEQAYPMVENFKIIPPDLSRL
jgi:hypothetical protein